MKLSKLQLSEQELYEASINAYWKSLNAQTKKVWGKVTLQVVRYKKAKEIIQKVGDGKSISAVEKDYLEEYISDTLKVVSPIMALPMGIPLYLVVSFIAKKYMGNKILAA